MWSSQSVRLSILSLCAVLSISAASRPDRIVLPSWFEASSSGQVFHTRGTVGGVSVDSRGAWLQVRGQEEDSLVRLRLLGAEPKLLQGEQMLGGKTHVFLGRNPGAWRRDVPQFQRVRAHQVYPGIDVVYYVTGRQLEFDFVVAPGADPAQIAMRLEGGSAPALTSEGDLRLQAAGVDVLQHRPVAFQVKNGQRETVDVRYVLDDGGRIRLQLGAYDPKRELVIDPIFSFSGYFGGGTAEVIHGVAAAPDGTFWITGTARSVIDLGSDFPPYQSELKGQADAFLAQIEQTGPNDYRVKHFSYIGGTDDDEALAVAVGANGRACITGWSLSFNFPLAGNSYQTNRVDGGDRDAFVTCYDATQGGEFNLTYSSYFGRGQRDQGQAIAVDSQGRVVIGGPTFSGDLPEIAGRAPLQPSNRGGVDGFIAMFDPNQGSAQATLIMATFFGGDGSDTIDGIAILPNGNIVVAGGTSSTDLPIAGTPYRSQRWGLGDGYLAVVNPLASGFEQLVYSTYFGGNGLDRITSMQPDAEGSIWVTGFTQSTEFPVTPSAWATNLSGSTDGFIAKLDLGATGDNFVKYASYFGAGGTDIPYAITVLSPVRAAIAGYSNSSDYPSFGVVGAPVPPVPRLTEMFVAGFDISKPGTGSLDWSLLFGGAKTDVATGLASQPDGRILLVGYTDSYGLNGIGEDIPGKRNGPGLPTGFFFGLQPETR